MFTALKDLIQNTDISTIQLHASDYELALKRLLTIYKDSDRHEDSPVYYWNNGYQNLVGLKLVEEKLRYSIAQGNETSSIRL